MFSAFCSLLGHSLRSIRVSLPISINPPRSLLTDSLSVCLLPSPLLSFWRVRFSAHIYPWLFFHLCCIWRSFCIFPYLSQSFSLAFVPVIRNVAHQTWSGQGMIKQIIIPDSFVKSFYRGISLRVTRLRSFCPHQCKWALSNLLGTQVEQRPPSPPSLRHVNLVLARCFSEGLTDRYSLKPSL